MSYATSPPLMVSLSNHLSGGGNSHSHSEPFGYAQVCAKRANRFYVQDTSLVCQNANAAFEDRFGFFVASLLRMTNAARLCHSEPFGYAQGKLREESRAVRPLSVQVYAKRANRFYVQDTSLVCQDVYTAFEDRLGFFVASLLRMTAAARLCHSEPFGYAQGKLREESKASGRSAFRSTQRGPTDSMCRTRVSFVRMYTQHSRTAWDSSSFHSSE